MFKPTVWFISYSAFLMWAAQINPKSPDFLVFMGIFSIFAYLFFNFLESEAHLAAQTHIKLKKEVKFLLEENKKLLAFSKQLLEKR